MGYDNPVRQAAAIDPNIRWERHEPDIRVTAIVEPRLPQAHAEHTGYRVYQPATGQRLHARST